MKKNMCFSFAISLFFFCESANAKNIEVVTESFPPFSYIKDNEVQGIVTERVRQVLSLAKLNYTIRQYPWARSYAYAPDNPNTIIYPIYNNENRRNHFHWFCPMYPATPAYIYKLKSNPLAVDTFEGFKSTMIGVIRDDNSISISCHMVLNRVITNL